MPDLSDKVLKLASGRYFFVPFITLLTSDLHFMISEYTLEMTSFFTGGGGLKQVDLIAKYPETWYILKLGYIGASNIGIAITADLLYRNIFIKLLPKHSKLEELEESHPPPYPYDADKLQMIIGLKHQRISVDKIILPTWIIVDEKGMYQNFLVTGTIGTGKTAFANP